MVNLAEYWEEERRKRLLALGWSEVPSPYSGARNWQSPDGSVTLAESEAFDQLLRLEREAKPPDFTGEQTYRDLEDQP